jgi:hypothetical protein
MPEQMSSEERKHWNLATQNNNTFRRFLLKYGDKGIGEIINSDPGSFSRNRFRGPEDDRYVLDPTDHSKIAIDMTHFLNAAIAPLGLGNELGFLVEVQQLLQGQRSAFQSEDFKSNYLGSLFGRYYLNDPSTGKTFGEKFGNFGRDHESGALLERVKLDRDLMNMRGSVSDPNLAQSQAKAITDELIKIGIYPETSGFGDYFLQAVNAIKQNGGDIDPGKVAAAGGITPSPQQVQSM